MTSRLREASGQNHGSESGRSAEWRASRRSLSSCLAMFSPPCVAGGGWLRCCALQRDEMAARHIRPVKALHRSSQTPAGHFPERSARAERFMDAASRVCLAGGRKSANIHPARPRARPVTAGPYAAFQQNQTFRRGIDSYDKFSPHWLCDYNYQYVGSRSAYTALPGIFGWLGCDLA